MLGERDDGVDAHRTLSCRRVEPNAPVLELEADVGIGNIEVRRG